MDAQTPEDAESRLKTLGYWNDLTEVVTDFRDLIAKYDQIGNPFEGGEALFWNREQYCIRMDIFTDLTSENDFSEDSKIKEILGIAMTEIYKLRLRIDDLKNKIAKDSK